METLKRKYLEAGKLRIPFQGCTRCIACIELTFTYFVRLAAVYFYFQAA